MHTLLLILYSRDISSLSLLWDHLISRQVDLAGTSKRKLGKAQMFNSFFAVMVRLDDGNSRPAYPDWRNGPGLLTLSHAGERQNCGAPERNRRHRRSPR